MMPRVVYVKPDSAPEESPVLLELTLCAFHWFWQKQERIQPNYTHGLKKIGQADSLKRHGRPQKPSAHTKSVKYTDMLLRTTCTPVNGTLNAGIFADNGVGSTAKEMENYFFLNEKLAALQPAQSVVTHPEYQPAATHLDIYGHPQIAAMPLPQTQQFASSASMYPVYGRMHG